MLHAWGVLPWQVGERLLGLGDESRLTTTMAFEMWVTLG